MVKVRRRILGEGNKGGAIVNVKKVMQKNLNVVCIVCFHCFVGNVVRCHW